MVLHCEFVLALCSAQRDRARTPGGLVAPPHTLRGYRGSRLLLADHPDPCPPCSPGFVQILKNFLLPSFRNNLSSYYVLDAVLSTEDTKVNETDKEPTVGLLPGCRDDKQVSKKN